MRKDIQLHGKTGKVQSSKVLISAVGSGNTCSYSISTTVSQPSSIVTVGVTTVKEGEDDYVVVNLIPTETGAMTADYSEYVSYQYRDLKVLSLDFKYVALQFSFRFKKLLFSNFVEFETSVRFATTYNF